MVDVDEVLEKLKIGTQITELEIKGICDKARELLDKLENVASLTCPITV